MQNLEGAFKHTGTHTLTAMCSLITWTEQITSGPIVFHHPHKPWLWIPMLAVPRTTDLDLA